MPEALFLIDSLHCQESALIAELEAAVVIKCFFNNAELLGDIILRSLDVYYYFMVPARLIEASSKESLRKVLCKIPDTRIIRFKSTEGAYSGDSIQRLSPQLSKLNATYSR